MTDPILTPTEWANWRRARAANDALMLEMMLAILSRAGRWSTIASLALDGEPDGFTGTDVAGIITAAGDECHVATKGSPAEPPARERAHRLATISARLAQLRAPNGPR